MRLARLANMPPATSGPLKLSAGEVKAIEDLRSAAARRRRILYLRETCPTETQGVSTESLEEHLRVSEQTGSKLGLVSEGAHCRWAYLMVATRGQIAQAPEVTTYIKSGGSQPDDQVRLIMKSTAPPMGASAKATTGILSPECGNVAL
ncbi:hypothetical protein GGD50_004778 [Rhizobium paranaense]|uniref:Uncharacterized protein n=1 Tax=Rhizobium paranaense TaxID=1650438 RepID=A0A7W8XV34_9HYPH|nr:hypothetical protein [Rhizobium paranaense]